MAVEKKILTILSAAAAVTALCPAVRIKVPGDWQNLARPYIVHFPVSVQPQHDHTGLEALAIWDPYQVSVFADTYSGAVDLAEQVRIALDGTDAATEVTAFWSNQFVGPNDPDLTIQHIVMEFRIAESLT